MTKIILYDLYVFLTGFACIITVFSLLFRLQPNAITKISLVWLEIVINFWFFVFCVRYANNMV